MKWFKLELGTRGLISVHSDSPVEGSDIDIKNKCREELYDYMFEALLACNKEEQAVLMNYCKEWCDIVYKEGIVYEVILNEETCVLFISEEYVYEDKINDSNYLRDLVIWIENDVLRMV